MSDLRNKLLEIEPLDALPLSSERNEKLQQEIRAMFETKLTSWEKWYYGASAAGSAVFAAAALVLVCFAPVPPAERMIWGTFGVINALVAAFILRRMWKGSMNLREQFALGKAAVGVTLGIAILILMNALWHPTLENLAWGLFGVTALVLAATIAIHNRVMAAELDSREHTLKLEYRLAELLDKLGGHQ